MKKTLLPVLMLGLLIGTEAQAQINIEGRKARPRAECERLCNEMSINFPHNRKGLDKILAIIDQEKDPEKLKELRQKEKEELDKAKEKIEKDCSYICEGNPD